ncbi:protein FAM117B-like [Macrosteles quadrilineatus]|uniref:protein FAM117B-like n=1 Tax=Macrosteles quadrilineatus TaxID=74068 RepID=UPI0023E09361|nr:protein FAM117B-like [Macrosteles quadrilineatus]XP_054287476.1 protein FAM117B-like [Macrosteles quadrilineatus]
MSGQSSQWVRKSSPSSKHGPMKATLPMSSLTRQNSNLIQSQNNSPTLSPTSSWKSRTSPDPPLSGLRSPGAVNYRGKSKRLEYLSTIRRTASLDTIYLMGQWPRDMYSGLLQVDKATQTEETMGDPRKAHRHCETPSNEDKLEKYIRHRLQRVGSSRERTAAFGLMLAPIGSTEHGSQTATPPPFSPPGRSRAPMRSSIEGLNQEIERLVLRATSTLSTEREEEKLQLVHQATPEGHRAPLADLLRSTRSVNTQTPAFSSHSSGPPSRESGSPLVVGNFELASRPSSDFQGSGDSSPEQDSRPGTSPRINKFLAREPPDGCERVSLKFSEDVSNRKPMLDLSLMELCPIKPSTACQFKPSLGSAFMPLSRPVATSATTSHDPPSQL